MAELGKCQDGSDLCQRENTPVFIVSIFREKDSKYFGLLLQFTILQAVTYLNPSCSPQQVPATFLHMDGTLLSFDFETK